MADSAAPATPPAGTKPMMISGANMEKYGLKTGDSLTDTVRYKLFPYQDTMDEINRIGFYSAFHEFVDELRKYPSDEEILIMADPEEQYGQNWLVCLTRAAKEAQLEEVHNEEAKAQEAERLLQEEEERKRAEAEAIENAVYEDVPIVPRPWESETAEETVAEVEGLAVQLQRPLLGVRITRPRSDFGHVCKFSDRDADVSGVTEWRQHKDPNYELSRRELDIGLQAVCEHSSAASQTSWFHRINHTVQYAPISLSADELLDVLESEALHNFLEESRAKMEESLQQNETIDIFCDEFSVIGDEDVALGNQTENTFKELRTFTDLEYSKNKALSAVDWHPTLKGVVAVSATKNISFDEQVTISGRVSSSYILIWNFSDLIHPQLMLESPHDAHVFRFNPSNPSVIAAGCLSGQVMVWDIREAMSTLSRRKNKTAGPGEDEDGQEKTLPPVEHESISAIDSSHKRGVSDLYWLPPGTEVSPRGQIRHPNDTVSHQFVTVAGDGQVLVWDTRYKEIARRNPRAATGVKPNKDGTMPDPVWHPHFRVSLTKLEGAGELGLCRLCMCQSESQEHSSRLFCSTEDGEMVFADWLAKTGGGSRAAGGGDDDDEGDQQAPEYVQWTAQDHFRPVLSLERSPFFNDILLTVSDWGFHLWKEGRREPIFSSCLASSYLTVGRWSPTRPGVIFVGKADGGIDLWDLADQSHRPSATMMVAPSKITSMEFWLQQSSSKQQLLAVGDGNGNLHILDTPRNLCRALNNEESIISSFLEREIQRCDYVAARAVVRRQEAEQEANAAGEELEVKEDADAERRALEAAEREYRELETKFREELGLDPISAEEDLVAASSPKGSPPAPGTPAGASASGAPEDMASTVDLGDVVLDP